MTKAELAALEPGDIIRHKHGAEALVVTANYGDRATAIRTYDVSNPPEWDLLRKHHG